MKPAAIPGITAIILMRAIPMATPARIMTAASERPRVPDIQTAIVAQVSSKAVPAIEPVPVTPAATPVAEPSPASTAVAVRASSSEAAPARA